MLILIICLILLLIGVIAITIFDADECLWESITILSGIVLFILLTALPFSQQSDRNFIARVNITRATINNARKDTTSKVERVELQKIIIETNQDIASLKFSRITQWKYWDDPAVDTLQYLK